MAKQKNLKVLLFLESSREFGRQLLRGIVNYASNQPNWVFVFETEWTKRMLLKQIMNIDGIIAHIPTSSIMNIISKAKIPAVVATFSQKAPAFRCIIKADSKAIGKMAAEHFLTRGFTNFGYCGYGSVWYSKEREIGFIEAIAKSGFLEPQICNYRKRKGAIEELATIAKWLDLLQKPCGIFACNDDLAEKVLEACKIKNIKVPDEVSILGVDNDEFVCNLTHPPLSSIAINGELAGYEAATMLEKMMLNPRAKVSNVTLLPTHVVVRQSTDSLAIKDTAVSKSLQYIAQHCTEPITVSQVVYTALSSRRILERKFRKILGKSILEQIHDMRADRIARALLETDLSISQISYEMGFNRVDHACRYFRRRYGMSPNEYRQKYGSTCKNFKKIRSKSL